MTVPPPHGGDRPDIGGGDYKGGPGGMSKVSSHVEVSGNAPADAQAEMSRKLSLLNASRGSQVRGISTPIACSPTHRLLSPLVGQASIVLTSVELTPVVRNEGSSNLLMARGGHYALAQPPPPPP